MDFATACRGLSVVGIILSIAAAWWAASGYDGNVTTGAIWLFSGLFSSCALGAIGEISARAEVSADHLRKIEDLMIEERRAREKADTARKQ